MKKRGFLLPQDFSDGTIRVSYGVSTRVGQKMLTHVEKRKIDDQVFAKKSTHLTNQANHHSNAFKRTIIACSTQKFFPFVCS